MPTRQPVAISTLAALRPVGAQVAPVLGASNSDHANNGGFRSPGRAWGGALRTDRRDRIRAEPSLASDAGEWLNPVPAMEFAHSPVE